MLPANSSDELNAHSLRVRGSMLVTAEGRGRTGRWIANSVKAIALGLLLALGLPGRSADERAIKSRVAPVYPEIAKRMRISGAVKMQATVDADGKVTDVKVISGNSALVNSAEDAVRKWRFAPGPAVSEVEVTINFDYNE